MSRVPTHYWYSTLLWMGAIFALGDPVQAGWKAGAARGTITPKEPMWMAGYAARNHPSEGAEHDLWAKALSIQDPAGKRGVLVTLDVCGIDRELSNQIRDALEARYRLPREQVVLSCSHTHCGPVVGANLITMYPLDEVQRARIADYARFLKTTILDVVDKAIGQLDDASLDWENGRCDFAVNRRNNPEKDVPALRTRLALAGPVDHDVPVLRIRSRDRTVRAIVFGYACHCTVLDYSKFCGDYAGFAAIDLERDFPNCQAMFVAGCGGDQNPIPRRELKLAEGYGRQLASAVGRVATGSMRPIQGPLRTAYQEIDLAFGSLPTREQLEADTKSTNFAIASRARYLLGKIAEQGKLAGDYPYPVQAWSLDELNWVFLGGEATVDYSLRIKRNMGGSHTWVSAYCNDVMAYIPSLRVLKEGGYEGATSMIYYGQPTVWSQRVEEDVIAGVSRALEAIAPDRSRE
jgi:Neutral/alkaline non-lysosomal ceramidase, N-terminal